MIIYDKLHEFKKGEYNICNSCNEAIQGKYYSYHECFENIPTGRMLYYCLKCRDKRSSGIDKILLEQLRQGNIIYADGYDLIKILQEMIKLIYKSKSIHTFLYNMFDGEEK